MAVRNYNDIGENAMRIINGLTDVTKSQNLLRYLFYTDMDPLGNSHSNITQAQVDNLIKGKLVRIIPRVGAEETANPIIVLKFDSFIPLASNPEFKTVTLTIEVFCPLSSWIIKGDNLRPFAIMGEIEKALSGKTVNGLGKLENIGAELSYLTDEMSVYEMSFKIISYD